MKKLVSVVAALVLCLAMTTTCFAASPTGGVISETPGVTVGNIQAKDLEKVDKDVASKESIQKAIDSVASGKYTVSEAATIAVFDLSGAKDQDVTLAFTGVKADKTYVVVHWKDDGTVEVIPAKAENGKITFHVTSCSPFAIVEVTSAAVTPAAATSPKTSEAGAMAAVAVMLISAAGIVVLNRRKFA